MTEDKNRVWSLDVVYVVFILLVLLCFMDGRNIIDLLMLVITTVYYIRIKIYRWKKYH